MCAVAVLVVIMLCVCCQFDTASRSFQEIGSTTFTVTTDAVCVDVAQLHGKGSGSSVGGGGGTGSVVSQSSVMSQPKEATSPFRSRSVGRSRV